MPLLKIISRLLLMGACVLASHMALSAQIPPDREFQLKAVFLYNFTQFVEWPGHVFPSSQSPMVIGILGADPFGSYLQETVSGEKINGHPLQIRHFNSVDDVSACQILFINLTDHKARAAALAKLKGKNILTVSDAPDFTRGGGMIRFYKKQDKIKLEVNLEATKNEDLVLSSKLLRLVEIFSPGKK